jgi:hypothetical protein
MITKSKNITAKQAIKLAKKQFIEEHGKRAYNAHISIVPRYAGGRYVHIMASGVSTEFYFN